MENSCLKNVGNDLHRIRCDEVGINNTSCVDFKDVMSSNLSSELSFLKDYVFYIKDGKNTRNGIDGFSSGLKSIYKNMLYSSINGNKIENENRDFNIDTSKIGSMFNVNVVINPNDIEAYSKLIPSHVSEKTLTDILSLENLESIIISLHFVVSEIQIMRSEVGSDLFLNSYIDFNLEGITPYVKLNGIDELKYLFINDATFMNFVGLNRFKYLTHNDLYKREYSYTFYNIIECEEKYSNLYKNLFRRDEEFVKLIYNITKLCKFNFTVKKAFKMSDLVKEIKNDIPDIEIESVFDAIRDYGIWSGNARFDVNGKGKRSINGKSIFNDRELNNCVFLGDDKSELEDNFKWANKTRKNVSTLYSMYNGHCDEIDPSYEDSIIYNSVTKNVDKVVALIWNKVTSESFEQLRLKLTNCNAIDNAYREYSVIDDIITCYNIAINMYDMRDKDPKAFRSINIGDVGCCVTDPEIVCVNKYSTFETIGVKIPLDKIVENFELASKEYSSFKELFIDVLKESFKDSIVYLEYRSLLTSVIVGNRYRVNVISTINNDRLSCRLNLTLNISIDKVREALL